MRVYLTALLLGAAGFVGATGSTPAHAGITWSAWSHLEGNAEPGIDPFSETGDPYANPQTNVTLPSGSVYMWAEDWFEIAASHYNSWSWSPTSFSAHVSSAARGMDENAGALAGGTSSAHSQVYVTFGISTPTA
jgi:hypothetical protein